MIKALQAFLTGLFFTIVFDFLLFLGIKLHYIDAHGIKVFFNPFFVDNQNFIAVLILTLFVGWITIYQRSLKTAVIVLSLLTLISVSALVPPIGSKFGDALFRQTNQQITIAPHTYQGDILYIDRQILYFFDTDLQRLITLPKEKQ